MIILAIDTSSKNFSVAILKNQRVVEKCQLLPTSDFKIESPFEGNSSRKQILQKLPGVAASLFQLLQDLIQKSGLSLSDCDLVAVAQGPGGFTGLRAGVVAAKLLAYAHSIPLVAVNTLEVIAHQTIAQAGPDRAVDRLQVILNAQRKQLFVGQYEVVCQKRDHSTVCPTDRFNVETIDETSEEFCNAGFSLNESRPMVLMTHEQWLAQWTPDELVTGSGLLEVIKKGVDLRGIVSPRSHWFSSAEEVGRLAQQKFQHGQMSDIWTIEPLYFRPSYAEED